MDLIKAVNEKQLKEVPQVLVGDTVRVFVKVVEGSRERLQNFEGVVIKIQGGGIRKSCTVRRISYGIGVERTFPYNSPRIGRIEVLRHGQVRRAKLFYLRNRVGKAAKVVERIDAICSGFEIADSKLALLAGARDTVKGQIRDGRVVEV